MRDGNSHVLTLVTALSHIASREGWEHSLAPSSIARELSKGKKLKPHGPHQRNDAMERGLISAARMSSHGPAL